MTKEQRDRIECAIRHIDSCLDVDPWARDIAIDAMQKLLEQVTGKLDIWDALSRVYNMDGVPDEAKSIIGDVMLSLPSEEPETHEKRTETHACDLISRQNAIDALAKNMPSLTTPDGCGELDHDIQVTDEAYVDCMQIIHELPSVQHTAAWELDEQQEHVEKVWHCSNCGYRAWGSYEKTDFCGGCGARMEGIDE